MVTRRGDTAWADEADGADGTDVADVADVADVVSPGEHLRRRRDGCRQ